MSQTTFDAANAEMIELAEKLLKLANLQADTALKREQMNQLPTQALADILLKQAQTQHLPMQALADTLLKQAQTRFLPWQVWTAGLASGAAVAGAAVALGHWL